MAFRKSRRHPERSEGSQREPHLNRNHDAHTNAPTVYVVNDQSGFKNAK
jgi:hypothetical protein